jgi:putative hydrolase of the HAD superfamily
VSGPARGLRLLRRRGDGVAAGRARTGQPPEAVIFDLGCVLIDLDWGRAFRRAARWTRLGARETERRWRADGALPRFETGRMTPRQYHAHMQRVMSVRIPYSEFRRLWCSIFTREIGKAAKLARDMHRRGRVRVAVLSNINVVHADYLRRRWPLLRELRHVFLSHEIGLRKPDPAAYRYVLRRLGLLPRQVAFVDDLRENVAVARELGMRCVLARSPEVVAAALRRMGLLSSSRAEAKPSRPEPRRNR